MLVFPLDLIIDIFNTDDKMRSIAAFPNGHSGISGFPRYQDTVSDTVVFVGFKRGDHVVFVNEFDHPVAILSVNNLRDIGNRLTIEVLSCSVDLQLPVDIIDQITYIRGVCYIHIEDLVVVGSQALSDLAECDRLPFLLIFLTGLHKGMNQTYTDRKSYGIGGEKRIDDLADQEDPKDHTCHSHCLISYFFAPCAFMRNEQHVGSDHGIERDLKQKSDIPSGFSDIFMSIII